MRIYIKHNKFKFVFILPLIAIKTRLFRAMLASQKEDDNQDGVHLTYQNQNVTSFSKEEYRQEMEKVKIVCQEIYKELKKFRRAHGKFTLLSIKTKDTNVKIVI